MKDIEKKHLQAIENCTWEWVGDKILTNDNFLAKQATKISLEFAIEQLENIKGLIEEIDYYTVDSKIQELEKQLKEYE